MMPRTCAIRSCGNVIRQDSRTGLCRDHLHTHGLCHCRWCTGTYACRDIIVPRAELVRQGLLPEAPVCA